MVKNNTYDIFISYRRDGGVETARLIYDRLTRLGNRVSFDMETLRSGKFNTQLYERIDHCKDVLVLLSNKALELRDNPSEDWFRLEVAHALKHQKNIIPVFLRDFTWPEKKMLPDDISELYDYEGVSASDEHFDSTVKKICSLLKSIPVRRILHLYLAILVSLFLTDAIIAVYYFRDKLLPFSVSKVQMKQLSELVYVVCGQGNCANQLFNMKKVLLEAASDDLSNDNHLFFFNTYNHFDNELKNMNIEKWKPSEDLLEKLQDMPFESTDIYAAYDYLQSYYNEATNEAKRLKYYMSKESQMLKTDLNHYIQILKDCLELQKKYYTYLQMSIFKDIPQKMMSEYYGIAKNWTAFPNLSEPWKYEEKTIKNLQENCLITMEDTYNRLFMQDTNMSNNLAQNDHVKFPKAPKAPPPMSPKLEYQKPIEIPKSHQEELLLSMVDSSALTMFAEDFKWQVIVHVSDSTVTQGTMNYAERYVRPVIEDYWKSIIEDYRKLSSFVKNKNPSPIEISFTVNANGIVLNVRITKRSDEPVMNSFAENLVDQIRRAQIQFPELQNAGINLPFLQLTITLRHKDE